MASIPSIPFTNKKTNNATLILEKIKILVHIFTCFRSVPARWHCHDLLPLFNFVFSASPLALCIQMVLNDIYTKFSIYSQKDNAL